MVRRVQRAPIADCFRGIFYATKNQLEIFRCTSKQESNVGYALFCEFKKTAGVHREKFGRRPENKAREETRLYEQAAFEGKDPGGHTLSINADGAASHAHTIPKMAGRVPKGMPEWHQQLQGMVFTRACTQSSQRISWCERKCKYVSHYAAPDLSAVTQRPASYSKAAHGSLH
jgi:hypothetical protein